MNPTLGQNMTRTERRELTEQAVERQYKGGQLFAPIQFKADDEDPDFMKPLEFRGFANTGHPDWGRDIVDPGAFSKRTISEFLKYGRQLLHMHNPYEQIGEITGAEVIPAGKRGFTGNTAGGLQVEGFVDSPFDPETFMIPDHPLAKVIHFARMQVRKNRLKAMSIGWMPVKTERVKRKDPRTGEEAEFRLVKSLLLREVSLVTFAMNPQSLAELRKGYAAAYGEEIADALICENAADCENIPEKVDDFTFDKIRELVSSAILNGAERVQKAKGAEPDEEKDETETERAPQLKLVSLEEPQTQRVRIVSL